MLVDTHCHLNHPDFAADLDQAVERALAAGVEAAVVIGYDLASSQRACELAERFPSLRAAVGIHPHAADEATPVALGRLRELAGHPQVLAIGEIGLDFYRDLAPRDSQEGAFSAQLDLALSAGLPVVVHTRESTTAALDAMQKFAVRGLSGVLHCWSGTPEEAGRAIDDGWWLGIGGVVTYKNAHALRAVAESSPLDRLVLETDAPYLAPQPERGRRNEPAYLRWVAEKLAQLRGLTLEQLAARTTANAMSLFPRLSPR
jgi:TatD DNase family protein